MTPNEYKLLTRAESAEYTAEANERECQVLRSKLDEAISCIAKISYCSAQCGADAMEMRNLAMDYMRRAEAMGEIECRSPAGCSPVMDAGAIFAFLRERMEDETAASLNVACRALSDHLRVLASSNPSTVGEPK